MPGVRLVGLWRHGDFLKLWAGQTVSLFGSEVSVLAVPLTAALTLNAGPVEMGILAAAPRVPYLLFGLVAGVWVDRKSRRPILLLAELGRATLMGSIPVVAVLGLLTMEYLYAATFLVGILTVFYDVGYQSFLPTLVPRARLIEGNSKLETSRSAAQIAGPSLAGWLIHLVGPPAAILADAATFWFSAVFLTLIRVREPAGRAGRAARGVRAEIAEGLKFVMRHPYLRAIAGSTATSNLFDAVQTAVFVLYLTRELGVDPWMLGLIYGVGNFGLLAGTLTVGAATGRFGLGRIILGAAILMGLARAMIPLAAGPLSVAIVILIGSQFTTALGRMLYNVSHLSLRQTITPDPMLGRVNASMRFIAWGAVPVGALIGGWLGETIGLRAALAVGAIAGFTAILWVLASPVPSLYKRPAEVDDLAERWPSSAT